LGGDMWHDLVFSSETIDNLKNAVL
jgi:hypothetical protein